MEFWFGGTKARAKAKRFAAALKRRGYDCKVLHHSVITEQDVPLEYARNAAESVYAHYERVIG